MHYRTALITGASSGIGRGLAARLAREGTHVVVCARRAEELGRLNEEITQAGGRARVEPLDVSDTERTVQTIRAIDEEVGGLDLIVANAGVGVDFGADPLSWESIASQCQVNFCGAAATLTAVLPRMVARGRGHIVGVSSLAALAPLPGSSAYCASKAGLSMLLAGLRMDLVGTGVAVTAVHPGFVKTPMTDRNHFSMPFLMECADAVELLMRRLPRAPATIDFPAPLSLAARFGAIVPGPIRDRLLRSRTSPGPGRRPAE